MKAIRNRSASIQATQEHEFEASLGLPEKLPLGEHILWQGAPQWRRLALEVFKIRSVALYLLAMWVFQWIHLMNSETSVTAMLKYGGLSALLACISLALLAGVSWLMADAALYTLTNKRIVLRIGIVLTVTFNLPLTKIVAAQIKATTHTNGDIALQLPAHNQIAWLHLWPHARPWHFNPTQPTLRCIDEVEKVSALFMQAWHAENPNAAVKSQHLNLSSNPLMQSAPAPSLVIV